MFRRSARIRSPVQPVKYVCAALVPRFRTPAITKSTTMIVSVCRSCFAIPSSIARPARYGGARAVAVAARSEMIASAVWRLYGAARRASVVTRRTVRCHDQSSIFTASRSLVRWLPGCQTFIRCPPLRSLPRGARTRLRANRARGCRGRRRSSGAAPRRFRVPRSARCRGRRARRRGRSSTGGAR